MNSITRGVRNAFRNVIRTGSIVIILGLSIGLALTMLVARQAVQARIDSVKGAIGNQITVSPAGARGFEGGGEPLTAAEMDKVKKVAHVTSVTETLNDRLDSTTTNLQSAIAAGSLGRRNNPQGSSGGNSISGETPPSGAVTRTFTPPVIVVGTSNTDGAQVLGGGGGAGGGGVLKITDGKTITATGSANEAIIGTALAAKNNLRVGSTFTAYGSTVTVVGIFDAGNQFSNAQIVMPIATVQTLSGQAGEISRTSVQVDSISNVDATVAALKDTLGSAADVVSQQDTSTQALQPLENIKTISLFSLIGAVGAGAVIILLTMLMIVRERRREIGVLKAIGASNVKVTLQFISEAVTLTFLGAIIGLAIGIVGSNPVTSILVANSASVARTSGPMGPGGPGGGFGRFSLGGLQNIQASVGWDILLYGLAAALVIAIVGSAIPAWLIAKVRPAEVMRAE